MARATEAYYLANGERISNGGDLFTVNSPWSGESLGVVRAPEVDVVSPVVDRAAHALTATAGLTAHERGGILDRLGSALETRAEEMAVLISGETGKTIRDCRAEVTRAVAVLRLSASAARSLGPRTFPIGQDDEPELHMIGYPVPVGVVAAIPAFNYPLVITAHKIGPAIAAGCPFVLKPSEKTPLSALLFGELILQTEWPREAVSVLPGDRHVGQALITHPEVRLVSFTGSTEVGREIAAQTGMAKLLLELGSNAPTIVMPDADLDRVVNRVAQGGYVANGQSCISVQRLLVHDDVHDELVQRLTATVSGLRLGDPADEATDVGPVIDDRSAERIEALIADAVDQGAVVHVGGWRQGRRIAPTLLSGLASGMRLQHEEVFGPVVAVGRFAHLDDAIELANDTPYGLQAGLFTNDPGTIRAAVPRLAFGGVHVNEISTFRPDGMPYGGVKASGIGKEGPRYALEDMVTYKMVTAEEGMLA